MIIALITGKTCSITLCTNFTKGVVANGADNFNRVLILRTQFVVGFARNTTTTGVIVIEGLPLLRQPFSLGQADQITHCIVGKAFDDACKTELV